MKEWIEKMNKEYDEKFAFVEKKCKFHHSAYYRGYVSRRLTGYIKPYKGKFGEGFAIYKPNWGSTRYAVVEYWIEK